MFGLTVPEVRSSPWPMLRRWLAERLPRRKRASSDGLAGTGRSSRRPATHSAQAPSLDPIVLRQWIYGAGCLVPGDELYLAELMSSVGLTSEMSFLDLNAGMGGGAIAVTAAGKCYVTGFERDPALVHAGKSFLRTHKAGRRVQLARYDPENFELRAGFYDCVMAREMISTLADKEAFLQAVSLGLKSFGQIVITDFVRGDAPAGASGLAAWAAVRERTPLLWASADYIACLKRLGCTVLVTLDATASYRSLLLRSWSQFLAHPELRHLRGRRARPLLTEVERCIQTLAAFDSGALRYCHLCVQSTNSTAPIR